MVTAAVYARISRDREGRELGVARQEEDCRELAGRLGAEVVEVLADNDLSASTKARKQRPGYTQLLDGARRGRWDMIIAYSSSRLTRRPLELETQIQLAEQYGTLYAYVRSPSFDLNTADGRATARTLAAWDAAEAERNAERVAREKRQAAENGLWRGGRRPYGYQADGVTVIPAEAQVVAWAAREVLSGTSLRSLATALNHRGVATSTGGRWHAGELRRVLLRPRNAGLVELPDGSMVDAKWDGIVARPVWRAVRRVLADPARRVNRPNHAKVFLGTSLYRCGLCDDGTTVRSAASSNGHGPYYTCKIAKHLTRDAQLTDGLVTDAVLGWLARPDVARQLVAPELDLDVLNLKILDLRNRLDEQTAAFGDGLLDRAQLARNTAKIRGELAELEEAQIRATAGHPAAELAAADDLRAMWQELDVARRQAVVDSICTVTLLPAPKGRPAGWQPGQPYFHAESVSICWRS